MARKGISKEKVFKAAQALAAHGELPTAIKLRLKLATGSLTTIQKYLREWRKNCFKNINFDLSGNTDLQAYNNELLEKYRILEQNLNKQINKNEYYAQELINAEKNNVAFKEENHQLQTVNQELNLRLTAAEAANTFLLQTTQEINNRLDVNENKATEHLQQIIDDLRLELKTLNETSIMALRETSNQGHEALMQERVVSINLQAKIDSLTKELLETKKQLHEAIMRSQIQIKFLSRQNEELQKTIQEHGLDKSPQLEGSSLQLANGVAVYGK